MESQSKTPIALPFGIHWIMNTKQQAALNAVRDCLHQHCQSMPAAEYKEVLEEVMTDLEGNLEALREEAGE